MNAKRGVWVEYVVVNDYGSTANALINGDIIGAWYTVNTYAQLGGKFREAGVDCVMPYIYSCSNGGDGIIVKNDVNSIEDWIGKKIAVSFYPDSRILVEWVIQNSSLSPEEIIGIRDNMKYYDTSDDVARAFFAGEVDIASTWNPYLDLAASSKESHVFFDTSMNKNLVLNGIVFRSDFIHENEEFVVNFIAAALEASTMYEQEFSYIHSIPMFEFMNNEEILNMVDDAGLVTWDENLKLLSGEAVQLYLDAARVWEELDYSVTPENAESAFTNEYIMKVQDKKEVKYEQ